MCDESLDFRRYIRDLRRDALDMEALARRCEEEMGPCIPVELDEEQQRELQERESRLLRERHALTGRPVPRVLMLVAGESGSGKDTAVDIACRMSGAKKVVSCTTRPRREGEGDTHIFLSREEFEAVDATDGWAARTEFDGHLYGARWKDVREADYYIIDPAGVRSLNRRRLRRAVCVARLSVPEAVRRARLVWRDGEEAAERRIAHDREAFAGDRWWDVLVSEPSCDSRKVAQLLERERLRRIRRAMGRDIERMRMMQDMWDGDQFDEAFHVWKGAR